VNIFKKIAEHASLTPKKNRIDYVSVGKRARDFLIRSGSSVIADFSDVVIDNRSTTGSRMISRFLYRAFEQGDYDRITVIHGYFISTLTQ
jgi:F0F1-type ATP synthase gamma subunit